MSAPPLGPRAVARAAGVSTDTLRHYERKGLLPRAPRTAAGHRLYSPSTVDRVLLIQRALVVGFSLADLKRILNTRDSGGAPCHSVRELLERRLDELGRRIDELSSLRAELKQLLKQWDRRLAATSAGQRAHLLETLGSKPRIEAARRNRASAHLGTSTRLSVP